MKSTESPIAAACPTRPDLLAFNSGALAPAALDAVGGHLAVCPHCLAVLGDLSIEKKDTLEDFRRSLKAADPEPFAGHPEYLRMEGRAIRMLRPRGLPPAEAPPRVCGQYRILEPIGRGGMGAVYRAEHTRLKRLVAIKLLSPGRTADPHAVARFQREMEAVGRLNHDNIVRASDAGDADGVHYLVMELIDGTDLSRLVAACGPLPIAEACEVARRAARGLQSAHELGLVHRDVKPSNLILSKQGELKVLDFGLASLAPGRPEPEGLTCVDQVMGTADYMAPEQWRSSHDVDTRADVYSLGCTLYFLLTGRPPFAGADHPTLTHKMEAHLLSAVPPIPGVPAGLMAVVERMLAKRPEDRFTTPGQASEALAAFAHAANLVTLAGRVAGRAIEPTPMPAPVPPRRPGRRSLVAAALIGLLLVGAAAAVALLPATPRPQPEVRTFEPGARYDLLERQPVPLFWPKPALHPQSFDPKTRLLRAETPSVGLISLGTSDGGSFTLDMTFQQPRWSGGFGAYLAGDQDPATGEVRAQAIEVLQRGKTFRIQRVRWTIQARPGPGPMVRSTPTHSADLVAPPGAAPVLLQVRVTARGVDHVACNGVPYPALNDSPAKPLGPRPYRGQFGLFVHGSTVTVHSASFFPN